MNASNVTESFAKMKEAAKSQWPAFFDVLRSAPVSTDRLRDAEKHLGILLPDEVQSLYRLSSFDGAETIEPIFDVYCFVPFDWLLQYPKASVERWTVGNRVYVPLLTDGAGSDLVFSTSRESPQPVSPILRREYVDLAAWFDSITQMCDSFAAALQAGVFPGRTNEDQRRALEIVRRLNPGSLAE